MARPPFTFDRNTLGSNGSFPLRFMAGIPFAGSQLKNVGHFTAMAPRRDNPLCRSAAHLSKGVLGLAVDMRLVACRRWQLWVISVDRDMPATGPLYRRSLPNWRAATNGRWTV